MVVHTKEGERLYRISPWAKYVTQEEKSVTYDWVHYDPPQPYIVSCCVNVYFLNFFFFSGDLGNICIDIISDCLVLKDLV